MGRVGLAFAVALLVLASGCAALPAEDGDAGPDTADDTTHEVTVTTVVDGDTARIRYRNGTTDTVRLLGVDTPETRGANDPADFEGVPDTEAGRECLREAGDDATRFLTRRVLGERVLIETDPRADARDVYDRLLAYVRDDGENVNYALIANGHARVYPAPFSQSDRFYAAQAQARQNGTGVWACATEPTPVPDGGDGGLAVARIHADAGGDDRENLNDEYVVFENRGEDPLDLSGWTVSDAANHTYQFPDGTTLDPGAQVTLRTGSGTDTGTERYWDRASPVWNNDGDTVVVRDRNGTVRARRSGG